MTARPVPAGNDVAGGGTDAALIGLLAALAAQRYRFVTTTPLTHGRVLARRAGEAARDLRDIFGWNLPFERSCLQTAMLSAMERAGVLRVNGDLLQSAVRVSTIGDSAFLHSAYPTVQDDSVFFGPDTYRFVRFIEQALQATAAARAPSRPVRVLDVGCGSGAGGIAASQWLARHGSGAALTMNDINPRALRFAAINAQMAGVDAASALGDAFDAVNGDFDLVISNPPYMADPGHRAYRDGGGGLGRELSVRIVAAALPRLAPGGQLLLYTGVAMTGAADPFLREVRPLLDTADVDWSYGEIDPDVFGEELELPAYAQAERIAAVGLMATRKPAER